MRLLIVMLLLAPLGCAQRTNPSFPLSVSEADQKIDEMATARRPLERPLVIIAGYNDLGVGPAFVASKIRDVCDVRDKIVTVSFPFRSDFESFREIVIAAIEEKFPSAKPGETVPVDVIGISLGGLVARYAADPPDEKHKRLNIVRLYAISAPLAGAKVADGFVWTDLQKQVRRDSPMIQRLNRPDSPGYELVCYTRLNDGTVGEHLAAPPGKPVWWVDNPPLSLAHDGAINDSRILADIERRLRHEPSLATEPPTDLPD